MEREIDMEIKGKGKHTGKASINSRSDREMEATFFL
jgi:hypothetical protein